MRAMAKEVKRRPYDAAKRQARSAETRQRILDAARERFLEGGYRATTIAAIAAQAEVNVDTVYQLVGRKPVLLRELIEQAISGTDRAVVAEERDDVRAIVAATDPVEKLTIYARAMRDIQQRMARCIWRCGTPLPPSPKPTRSGTRSASAGRRICASWCRI